MKNALFIAVFIIAEVIVGSVYIKDTDSLAMFVFIVFPFIAIFAWVIYIFVRFFFEKSGKSSKVQYVSCFLKNVADPFLKELYGLEYCNPELQITGEELRAKIKKAGTDTVSSYGVLETPNVINRAIFPLYTFQNDNTDINVFSVHANKRSYYGILAVITVSERKAHYNIENTNRNMYISFNGTNLHIVIKNCKNMEFGVLNAKKKLFKICEYIEQINRIKERL